MPHRRRPLSCLSFLSFHKNRQLEQRHTDQLRMVQEVAQAERDQLVSQLQRELDQRHQQLQQVKEEESRLKDQLVAMSEVSGPTATADDIICLRNGLYSVLFTRRIMHDWQPKMQT